MFDRLGSSIRLVVIAILTATVAASQPSTIEEIRLGVGAQKVLPADDVRSYSEGVSGICDVRLTRDASQFVLVGLAPGRTTLLFLMKDGTERHHRITVVDPDEDTDTGETEPDGVAMKENIRLDFYFVQIDQSYSHQLGIGWPASVGATARAGASYDLLHRRFNGATAVVTDQALPRLDMAQASGWAKVLRQAAIVTENGSQATFAGGGEVNIPIAGSLAAEIRAITFGSTVKVAPRYDRETGRIEVGIEADVADLVDDGGTGAPGRATSVLQTIVNLDLGQSIVLAGLTAQRQMRSRAGLPLLSDIPLLGALFGSYRASDQTSESAIIIVPTVVDAVSAEDRDRIKEALDAYADFQGDMGAVHELRSSQGKGRAAP